MAKKELVKRLRLEGRVVHYEVVGGFGWSTSVDKLVLLGEYTTPPEPHFEDHFFAFIIRPDYTWNEASYYSKESDKFLAALGQLLGAQLSCGLDKKKDYGSRIMWPPEIEGERLFDFAQAGLGGFWIQPAASDFSATTRSLR
jgi:hypothetical protein